ncbi:hypothetical protein [Actinoplanes regularis]|uniref:hypothetical protein n=1 Tax=Actinoplanes regularis TaxID=52697 RepID=UPI0024A1E8A6|nr:hypothetical protein [Actinoplanes regularis]GLW31451.1 hypothetical protein Areg01_43910 [Actinoplanes regularis]
MRSDYDRAADAVAQARAPKPAAPTREDLVSYTARRFDLTPEQAARIDAETSVEIIRQGRELSYQAARARATPEDGPAIRLALVPGHGVPDQAPEDFDPGAIVRRLRED